jgi:micrococcal nuclease
MVSWIRGTMLAAIGALAACDAGGGSTSAVVARVIDGDTIDLESGERVRYLMIDTPESTTEVECFGEAAAAFNRELVEGKQVTLSYGDEREDRFGRTLAFVSLGDREINTLLVERGFACVLYIPPNGMDRAQEFGDLEARARADGRGLWGECEDIPCN